MATRRLTGRDECPLTEIPAIMDLCQPCPYFRGASSMPGEGRQWGVLCNWPRNGSYIAPEKPGLDIPIPAVFTDAFAEDPAP